jgi:hypothetical protein
MSVDLLMSMVLLMSVDSCERAVETAKWVKSGFLMIVPTYAKVSIISKKLTFMNPGTVMIVIVWQLDLQLPMQSVAITTKIASSNPDYWLR